MKPHRYLIVSDLHLADLEDHADGWKRHKASAWTFDAELDALVAHARAERPAEAAFTFILNGDIFDFDLVTAIPEPAPWPVRRLERLYGLDATAAKSRWKLEQILDDHAVFVATLQGLVRRGHDVVVVMGNHDRELWFTEVAAALRERVMSALSPAEGLGDLRVEPWFFYAEGALYVEHGHQYDAYSSFRYNLEPVDPRGSADPELALAMGNLSNRLLLSNIGFFNPHQTDFILSGFGYLKHWLTKYAFTRRSLLLTWLLGSLRSLMLLLGQRVRLERHPPRDYARHLRAHATATGLPEAKITALYALGRTPITHKVGKIIREFWLDRVTLALAMTGGTVALALSGAALWVKLVVPLLVFPLTWFLYNWVAGGANALTTESQAPRYARKIAEILKVKVIAFGHTHAAGTEPLGGGAVFANSGTWAPTWEARSGRPTPGLRNFILVDADSAGRVQVEVGSWMPLESAAAPQSEATRGTALSRTVGLQNGQSSAFSGDFGS